MASLVLRFTAAASGPPELASFAGVDHDLLREQQADHDDTSVLADLVTARIVATRLRVVGSDAASAGRPPIFVPLRNAPIPAIASAARPVAAAAFVLSVQVRGHLAWPNARRVSRTGAALVLAACIPIIMPDVALAQQPAPAATAPAEPAPAVTPTPPAPVVVAPAVQQPQLETILRGMNGRDAVVFAAGTRVVGRIIGVEGDFVTMIDAERDGKIAMIPKAQISEVRGIIDTGVKELPSGTGNLIAGGVMVGVGIPLMIAGLVFLAYSPSSFFSYGFEVVPAAVLLGVGIPQIVIGKRKQRAFRAAQATPKLSRRLLPAVQRTAHGGWTGGLSFRF